MVGLSVVSGGSQDGAPAPSVTSVCVPCRSRLVTAGPGAQMSSSAGCLHPLDRPVQAATGLFSMARLSGSGRQGRRVGGGGQLCIWVGDRLPRGGRAAAGVPEVLSAGPGPGPAPVPLHGVVGRSSDPSQLDRIGPSRM